MPAAEADVRPWRRDAAGGVGDESVHAVLLRRDVLPAQISLRPERLCSFPQADRRAGDGEDTGLHRQAPRQGRRREGRRVRHYSAGQQHGVSDRRKAVPAGYQQVQRHRQGSRGEAASDLHRDQQELDARDAQRQASQTQEDRSQGHKEARHDSRTPGSRAVARPERQDDGRAARSA